jgi:cytochrome c2
VRERTTKALGWTAALLVAALAVIALQSLLRDGGYEQRRRIDSAMAATAGDPGRGKDIITRSGCGACHEIPGIPAARGRVGPSLKDVGNRAVIGGTVANTSDNLARWIRDPRALNPHTAMPVLNLSPDETRDVAAYLYTR